MQILFHVFLIIVIGTAIMAGIHGAIAIVNRLMS